MTEQLNSGLPVWAVESTDPYIVRLREACFIDGVGYVRAWFDEMIGAGAWSQALLKQQADAFERPDADDGLEMRALEVYADNAARRRAPMPSLHEVRASLDPWEPGPEDVVLALTLKGETEFAAGLLSEEAERDDDYGQEQTRVDMGIDAIEQLMAWAGRSEFVERVPLPTVLATLKARWDSLSDAQRRLVNRLVGQTVVREEVRGHTLVVQRRISTLYERANHAETQALIDEALDRWEELQAARDEVSHPDDTEPAVQVSLDNQARFLDWVAKGAKPAPAEKQAQKPSPRKPWLSRPGYIHVLQYALNNGARTPRDAHNRAYAADTLRLADRIVGCGSDGFLVVLNGKGQTGIVPFADARVAFPYLPAAAKARMKELHGAK